MSVTAVQFKPRKGDLQGSLARLVAFADQAAAGSRLVVLPEMAATGYIFRSRAAIDRVAEPAGGPTFEALRPIARRHKCWLVCGFPERDGDKRFNSAMVIDPSGALRSVYRKTLLFVADELWADPGDSGYSVFDTDVGRVTVGICMDLNDDRFTEWLRAQQPDICAFPTNWVEEHEPVWPYWQERIAGSSTTLVAANTYGWDESVLFSGRSAVLQHDRLLRGAFWAGDALVRYSPA